MKQEEWVPTIRRDMVKRYADGMMKANMKLYEQIMDDENGFGYYFNNLMRLALSEFKETRPRKRKDR